VSPPLVSVGDSWSYNGIGADGRPLSLEVEVLKVRPGEIVLRRNRIEATYSEPWIMTRTRTTEGWMSFSPGVPTVPFPLIPGTTLRHRTETIDDRGNKGSIETILIASRWEEIEVPAGRFRAVRVDREEEVTFAGAPARRSQAGTFWYSPQARVYIRMHEVIDPARKTFRTLELRSYALRQP